MLDKGKKIASFTMAPVHKGKKTLKLPKLKKGKHKLQVVYMRQRPRSSARSRRRSALLIK